MTAKKEGHHHHTHKNHKPKGGRHWRGEGEEPGIMLNPQVVEALLVSEGMGNRSAVKAVCQQIREAAQDQMPDKFPR